jgi:hypothetical protein
MCLISAAAAVFPSMSLDDLLWSVEVTFLYQAENIFGQRYGMLLYRNGSTPKTLEDELEKVTGRRIV